MSRKVRLCAIIVFIIALSNGLQGATSGIKKQVV